MRVITSYSIHYTKLYEQFRLQPLGRYVIRICKGTACHVQGAEMIGKTLEEELGIRQGETSEDGLFTFLTVARNNFG